MSAARLQREAVLRVGEVTEVDGRTIYVTVDGDKNLSDVFLHGDVLKNISVNSFLEIRKGFLSIICRVEGERISGADDESQKTAPDKTSRNKRILTVALAGYIDEEGTFTGGTKELPLIGNSAYIVTKSKLHIIHNLVDDDDLHPLEIRIANASTDDIDVAFPVDGLFNSHIAIFGNTGSGKSNTLASLYQELVTALEKRNTLAFAQNTRFVLFDFNGEYAELDCITPSKKVYALSTQKKEGGDRLPLDTDSLLDIDVLSILSDATEKTQRPFLKRTLKLFVDVMGGEDPSSHLQNIVRKQIKDVLRMSDKVRAHQLLDYLEEILPHPEKSGNNPVELLDDIVWHNKHSMFMKRNEEIYFDSNADAIEDTILYGQAGKLEFADDLLQNFIVFLYVQLIYDVLSNRAQNDHIAPVINRLKSKRIDIDKLFDTETDEAFWQSNFVVLNMHDVNLDMKKTIPLLVARKLYQEHKRYGKPNETLNIIIDEAHTVLSTESFRETDDWKNYRLETFEEIIKEGRKFGTFVTIASQRPNDISPTITSQAHNYFIHRLINDKDLSTIASAVSYIDKVTRESIPTLPTGTCIFSGIAGQMPIKVAVRPLEKKRQPRSFTRKFKDCVPYIEP